MSCDDQGILAGGKKEDTYELAMPCQFVVIDDLADGEYILEATINAPSVDAVKNKYKYKVIFEEDNYDDDTVAVRLRIKGDDVNVLKGK
jgi:Lysyl oxidase